MLAGGLCLSACGEVGESGGETEIIQADKETETVQAGGETGQVGGTEGQTEESARMEIKTFPSRAGDQVRGFLPGEKSIILTALERMCGSFLPRTIRRRFSRS